MGQPSKRRRVSWSELKLTVFITIVLVLVAVTVFFSGTARTLFHQKIDLVISLPDIGGLMLGAPVWMQGMAVGKVTAMRFTEKSIEVRISMDRSYQRFLYKNASARVKAIGLFGSKYVELSRGSASQGLVTPGQRIKGELADPLQEFSKNYNVYMNRVLAMADSVSSVVDSITEGNGVTGTLVNDTALATEVKKTVMNMNKLVEDVRLHPKRYLGITLFGF
jgi:phospholipid/cholesterol/gamma-HCH transport system substrate-binding protein